MTPEPLPPYVQCLKLFWEKSPLLLNNVKFVMSESASYGIYTPKATEEFAPGEVIYLYLEPVGQILEEKRTGPI